MNENDIAKICEKLDKVSEAIFDVSKQLGVSNLLKAAEMTTDNSMPRELLEEYHSVINDIIADV